jgi:anion-transporting  ArsA/GET3 family ATPase
VPSGLFERHLIFVTGKGGVGKSTVALALGIAASRRGLRTIVAEVGGGEKLLRAAGLGAGRPFTEVDLAPGLFTISIEPTDAMHEYLRVKTGPFGGALSHSRLFHTFAMATPGMRELLTAGKVWELSQPERRTAHAANVFRDRRRRPDRPSIRRYRRHARRPLVHRGRGGGDA